MNICLVTSQINTRPCGVADYTRKLAQELNTQGHQVTIISSDAEAPLVADGITCVSSIQDWSLKGGRQLRQTLRQISPDLVLVQWTPYLYSLKGISLALPLSLIGLSSKHMQMQTMLHELWQPMNHWKHWLISPVQRLAVFLLSLTSHTLVTSIRPWQRMLQRWLPFRTVRWVPIGSNITPRESSATAASRLTVGLFSPLGAGKQHSTVPAIWSQVSARHPDAELVILGVEQKIFEAHWPGLATDTRVHNLGYRSEEEVSAYLSQMHCLLAPFVDGVSSRRGTVVAALAHGVPVVTTRGSLTDEQLFKNSPLLLAENHQDALASNVSELIENGLEREKVSHASRQFFETHFSWQQIARGHLELWKTPDF